MKYIVLCPGSRSSPLALAAASVCRRLDLELLTSIDERSAAFLALGISAANGKATGVITTSGTAVANLLPAAVEADRSCHPLLFLTADRPLRLKECGANQSVNQEDFLKSVCRHYEESPKEGIHQITKERFKTLVEKSWDKAHRIPGPVHINLSFEEPLNPSLIDQREVLDKCKIDEFLIDKSNFDIEKDLGKVSNKFLKALDPFSFGVVIVGPWRGRPNQLDTFRNALKEWHDLTGWPIIADPLSGITNKQKGLLLHWEFLLSVGLLSFTEDIQVLRLGPLPSSREIQLWLEKYKTQLLVTEGDDRNLDPLGVAIQFSDCFSLWSKTLIESFSSEPSIYKNPKIKLLTRKLEKYDLFIDSWLNKKLSLKGKITEPSLARWLPRLLPSSVSVMLAASSPIRDWMIYSGEGSYSRRCFGFRGASGIDGTLSLGMGMSIVMGKMVLITGDLALLHDTNGWLFSKHLNTNLVVIMIDNNGGGIFNQLNIDQVEEGDFKEIFTMPQRVCPLTLAKAYGVAYRQVACLDDLELAIEWGMSLSSNVLIRVCTNSSEDHELRVSLRNDLKKHFHFSSQNLVNEI